jgi:radical S-adenosyl methionine domain-containing protein 2
MLSIMTQLKNLTANLFITKTCNYRCKFCFAQFPQHSSGIQLPVDKWKAIITSLAERSLKRVTLVGGEPTLYLPELREMIQHAKKCGLETSLVTNGKKLEELLSRPEDRPDMVGLSLDSVDSGVLCDLQRGSRQDRHVESTLEQAALIRSFGIYLKINTVVTALNHEEDMSEYILACKPDRWKIFQLLIVKGQNDQTAKGLEVTTSQFEQFIQRHQHLEGHGIKPIGENNDTMTESYLMIDPYGQFFDNANGVQHYSDPVPEIGVDAALKQIRFSEKKFYTRGGLVDLDLKG